MNTENLVKEVRKITGIESSLDSKTTHQYVNEKVEQIVSGTPKGAYPNLSALQSAKPTGDDGIYITSDNGSWNYWNGSSWVVGGVYQSSAILDRSINHYKTNFIEEIGNLFIPSKITDGYYIEWWNGELVSNANYCVSDYIFVNEGEKINISNKHNLAYFDSTKKYVSGIEQNAQQNVGTVFTTTVPAGAKSIRVSVKKTWLDIYFVSRNEFDNSVNGLNIQNFKLKDGSIAKNKLDFTKYKNLFNKNSNKNVANFHIDVAGSTGDLVSNPNYTVSHYINVKKDVPVTINNCRNVALYDYNNAFIRGLDNPTMGVISITPTKDCLLRFSYKTSNADYIQVEIGNIATYYMGYDEFEIPTLVLNSKQGNQLQGKVLFNFGDSIAAGDGNDGIGYAEIIAKNEKMTVYDYAVGGATIGITESNNIVTYMENAIKSGVVPDYALVEGGTNDIGEYNVPLGEVTNGYNATLDKTTFSGGLEYIFKTLKVTFLGCKICFVRVHNMGSRDATKQKQYGERAIEICKKWSVPYVDIYNEGGLNTNIPEMALRFTKDTYNQGTGDKTHPNDLGYKTYYVQPIISKMKTL